MRLFNNKKFFYSLVATIFIWGIALRAVEVLNGNYLFGFDIGRDLLVARDIVEHHKFTLIGAEIGSGSAGINGVFQGPGYYYLLSVVYILFRGNPYGALLMMFALGIGSLVLVYFTVRRMFNRATSAVALLLTGISPLIVSQSRFIWAPHPATPLIVLFLYFSYLIPKRPRIYAPLALLSAGLTYHFEFAMTVPIILAIVIGLPLIYRIRDVKTYLYSFGTLLLVFLPMVLFEMRHGWMMVRSFLSYTHPQGPVGRDVWFLRITDHMGPYIANAANSFVSEHGLLPNVCFIWLSGALLIALAVLAWRTKDNIKRQFFRFLLLLLAVTYISLLFLNNNIWDYYLIHAHFIYMYVFAYLFVQSYRRSKVLFAVLAVFLISMMISSAWRMMISYTYDIKDKGGVEKIYGKKYAIDYIYKDAKGKPFSEFTFMAPIYTYPYDYLFRTYGSEKYGYIPGNVKKGPVYLIIEPDASKPWTYKGWLETVIVGGTIVKTVTLPTGHIIQLRQFP